MECRQHKDMAAFSLSVDKNTCSAFKEITARTGKRAVLCSPGHVWGSATRAIPVGLARRMKKRDSDRPN